MVLPTEPVAGADADGFDLYLPSSQRGPAPVTVLVHGGPMRETPLVPGFRPSAELGTAARLPILLTRVGLEIPELAAAQQDFVDTAQAQGSDLTVIDVPDGHHAFDIVDDTDQSRQAIVAALDSSIPASVNPA